jgi:Radical SAM superfamily
MLTGIHILLTYRCTFECDHCFVHSSPCATGTFTRARLDEILRQAADLGTVDTIYFEGGEPSLFFPLLLEGIETARDLGFTTGVVTNAYWAQTVDDARLWLEPLHELGVLNLTFSDDALHFGESDPTPAARALEAANGIGLPAGTICTPSPEVDPESVRYRGRAAEKLIDGLPRHPWRSFTECPDEEFPNYGRVHVDPFGNVHVCQGVLIGNTWEKPLRDIMAEHDADAHPICGPLMRGGPAAVAQERGLEPETEYVSACHLCYEMRKILRPKFPEHLGPPGVYGETGSSA